MTALGRRERIAVGLWIIIAAVVWNGLYDLLLARSTQTYLFRQAIHQAGLGPRRQVTPRIPRTSWLCGRIHRCAVRIFRVNR